MSDGRKSTRDNKRSHRRVHANKVCVVVSLGLRIGNGHENMPAGDCRSSLRPKASAEASSARAATKKARDPIERAIFHPVVGICCLV